MLVFTRSSSWAPLHRYIAVCNFLDYYLLLCHGSPLIVNSPDLMVHDYSPSFTGHKLHLCPTVNHADQAQLFALHIINHAPTGQDKVLMPLGKPTEVRMKATPLLKSCYHSVSEVLRSAQLTKTWVTCSPQMTTPAYLPKKTSRKACWSSKRGTNGTVVVRNLPRVVHI